MIFTDITSATAHTSGYCPGKCTESPCPINYPVEKCPRVHQLTRWIFPCHLQTARFLNQASVLNHLRMTQKQTKRSIQDLQIETIIDIQKIEDMTTEDLYDACTLPMIGMTAQIYSLDSRSRFNGMIVSLERWDSDNQYLEARLENRKPLSKRV